MHVPQAHRAIRAGGCQLRSIGTEHGIETRHYGLLLACFDIPQPNGANAAFYGGQDRAIGAEGDARYGVAVAFQHDATTATSHIPQPYRPGLTLNVGKGRPIGAERLTTHTPTEAHQGG